MTPKLLLMLIERASNYSKSSLKNASNAQGLCYPGYMDYTSIFMKIKVCIKPIQNAHILSVLCSAFESACYEPFDRESLVPDLMAEGLSRVACALIY